MWKGVALGVLGTLAVVLAVQVSQVVAQPKLTQADRTYCAAQATVIADMWAREGTPGTIDPHREVALIAGYYGGDLGASARLAALSYGDNFDGVSAHTDRIDGPLTGACRALTYP